MAEPDKTQVPAALLLFLKGMAMGAADTVPGVSGGTIAFVCNIYEELILSIQRCNFQALRILFGQGLKAAWAYTNGNFLLTLLLGILSSALLLANMVSFLLANYNYQVMAFFIGLILASSLFLRREVKVWDPTKLSLLLIGVLLAVLINLLPQSSEQAAAGFVFFSGAIAICAMILPGISGAFILVLLGSYETVLRALSELDVALLSLFAAGCVVGLIAFSNLLTYLLKHFHEKTMALLLGILLGSLYGIWPWQAFGQQAGSRVWTLFVLLIMMGFALVYCLELLGKRSK